MKLLLKNLVQKCLEEPAKRKGEKLHENSGMGIGLRRNSRRWLFG